MKADTQFEVPVDGQIAAFSEHINNPQNERIIFSGIFGIGKSYFLERFFEYKKEKYVPIKLSPVNYSISSTDDIFRLLKYDILYELIVTHELELEQTVIDRQIAYGTILSSKTGLLLEHFLSAAQLLNKGIGSGEELPNPAPLINFLRRMAPKIEAIEKDRKDANLNQRILSFISSQESSLLFESDFVTGFIIESLQQLAGINDQKKETVLVIDDLDRIDPEHIFRLFNIFSSHLNYRKTTGNKFGFDKVVFVCDIENIRNIFSARYGESTDFSGYIDKFYSSEIFHFNNNPAVVAFTDKIVSNVKFDNNSVYAAAFLKNLEYGDKALLRFFIRTAINSGTLSLRKIISILKRQYNIDNHTLPLYHKQEITNTSFPAVVALEVMNEFYGGVALLRKALQKMSSFKKSRHTNLLGYSQATDDQNILGYFIPVLDYKQHNFKLNQSGDRLNALEYDFRGQKIKYELTTFNQLSHQYYGRVFPHNDVNYSFIVIDVILATLDHLVEIGYFKIE